MHMVILVRPSRIMCATRDYCTSSKHIVHMCLNAILVSIEMVQFAHVASYVGKAEQSLDGVNAIIIAKLRCAAGLGHLESRKYKLAARKVSPITSSFSTWNNLFYKNVNT